MKNNPLALFAAVVVTFAACVSLPRPGPEVGMRPALPAIEERPVDARCCLIPVSGAKGLYRFIDEAESSKLPNRLYFMDSVSWGNALKSAQERDGRIREYEQFPCVEK